jgi:GT2 family glycosyltransferase
VTRALSLLGAALPQHLAMLREDNEAGFWEPAEVVALNTEILESAGSDWDDVSTFPSSWFQSDEAASFRERARQVLQDEYDAAPVFVVKDPRICRLVPFWLRAIGDIGADMSSIHVVRNPLEVAGSLRARDGFAPAKSFLLWLRHVLDAEAATRGLRRTFVAYDDFLKDWRPEVTRIAGELALEWPRNSHEAHLEIDQFLSPAHRHHERHWEDLDARPDVVAWVKDAYEAVLSAAAGSEDPSVRLDAIREELDDADKAFGPLVAQATSLQSDLATRDAAVADLEATVESLRELVSRHEDDVAQLASVSGQLARARESVSEQQDEIQRLEQLVRQHESQIEDARGASGAREQELSAALAAAVEKHESEARELTRLTGREVELMATVRSLHERVEGHEAEEARLQAEVAQLAAATEEVARLTAREAELVARVESLQELQERHQAEVVRLEAEVAQLAAVTEERTRLAAREAELMGSVESLQALVGRQEAESARLQADVAQLAAISEELAGARAAAAEQHEQFQRLEQLVQERESQAEDLRAMAATREQELSAALAAALERHDDRSREVTRLTGREVELMATVEELASRLARADEDARVRDEEVTLLREDVERLSASASERGARLSAADAKLAELVQELDAAHSNAADQSEHLARLEETVRLRQAEAAKYRWQADRLESRERELAAEIATVTRRVEESERELRGSEREAQTLSVRLRSAEERARSQQQEVALLRAEVEKAGMEAAARERDHKALSEDAERGRAKVAALETQLGVADRGAQRSRELARGLELERAAQLDEVKRLWEHNAGVEQESRRLTGEVAAVRAELGGAVATALGLEEEVSRLANERDAALAVLVEREAELARVSEHDAELAHTLRTLTTELDAVQLDAATARDDATKLARHLGQAYDELRRVNGRLSPAAWIASRIRSLSHFLSWVVRPSKRSLSLIVAYLKLRWSGDFDRAGYRALYWDVARADLDPLMHYIEYGADENRLTQPTLHLAEQSELGAEVWRSYRDPGAPRTLPVIEDGAGGASWAQADIGPVDLLDDSSHEAELDSAVTLSVPAPSTSDESLRLRAFIRENVPDQARVLAATVGEEVSLGLDPITVEPFPQGSDGTYAADHPATDTALIVHLETLRAFGANYLLIPDSSLAWLDQFPFFRAHLERLYGVLSAEGVRLFALDVRLAEESSWRTEFLQVLADYRFEYMDEPAVLDWGTGLPLSEVLEGEAVFPASAAGSRLPYLDETVPVVAVPASQAALRREAQRVSSAAVVEVQRSGDEIELKVQWKRPIGRASEGVSIVVPCFNGWRYTNACLAALRGTLPPDFAGEVIVVDDASSDETADGLASLSRDVKWLRALPNESNLGFLESVRLGAESARGDMLVFLNNDTVPLNGWLSSLLRTFRQHEAVGAVGGKLLYPDGRIQEAGGMVFSDGSAAKFGYGHPDADAGFFRFVREVDYVSGCLLATPRAVYEEIGGFDRRFEFGYYEDTDYCFALRDRGYRVLYQPASVIVHVEGATAGRDLAVGPKRYQARNQALFAEKWREALERQPLRPKDEELVSLYAVAASRALGGKVEASA